MTSPPLPTAPGGPRRGIFVQLNLPALSFACTGRPHAPAADAGGWSPAGSGAAAQNSLSPDRYEVERDGGVKIGRTFLGGHLRSVSVEGLTDKKGARLTVTTEYAGDPPVAVRRYSGHQAPNATWMAVTVEEGVAPDGGFLRKQEVRVPVSDQDDRIPRNSDCGRLQWL